MSRIRSIHPGFFTDEDLVSVSMGARLLFLGLGIEADDKGVFEWKPLTIKMRIFPADSVDVPALLAELADVGAVQQYEMDGRKFGAIRNFRRFQRPKTPNDIHPISPEIRNYVGLAEPISEPFPPKGEKSPQMEEGGGKREEEVATNVACPSGDGPNPDVPDPESPDRLKPEHVVEIWNETAPRLGKPSVRNLTPERRTLLKARIAQYSLDDFHDVFGKIERSAFLRGDGGWRGCTFDWVFKKANFQKILEGNYDGESITPRPRTH